VRRRAAISDASQALPLLGLCAAHINRSHACHACPFADAPPLVISPAPLRNPAVVKVLKLLPETAMRFQLPKTLQKVANLLKQRMQSAR
jgi:hypothetical protein